jgi:hypothetical protein
MLTMRILLVILALLFTGIEITHSQEPNQAKANQKPQPQPKQSKQHAQSASDRRGSENDPLFIKVIPPLTAEQRSVEHTDHPNDYTSPEWALVWVTIILAVITAILAAYTAKLWGATKALAEDTKRTAERQAVEMKQSLRISEDAADAAMKTADAAVAASMPILSPYITDTTLLHPDPLDSLYHEGQFKSSIKLVFNNYGKTPGMIRQVRADLILVENDVLPENIVFEKLTFKEHEITIPGDTRWGITPALPGCQVEPPVSKSFTLSERQLQEVVAEATSNPYRRFYLIGLVIYDDFFGYRHTHRFCIKVRKDGFQSPKGGRDYNHVARETMPKNEQSRKTPILRSNNS